MNKIESRRCFMEAGIQISKGITLNKTDSIDIKDLKYPVFVKPASGGSSIGTSLVEREEDLSSALEKAFLEDERVIVDERIVGRELTVGILGERALPLIEISTKRSFFDYDAKYNDSDTLYLEPNDLDPGVVADIKRIALKAHNALGCKAFSRVDLILSADGPYVLEVNAIPGLSPKSLLPKMAKREGVSFKDLCLNMIKESLRKYGGISIGRS
jgi:D-alanine-D-alanine ligase